VDQCVELFISHRRPLDLGPGNGLIGVAARLDLADEEATIWHDVDQVEAPLEFLDELRKFVMLDDEACIIE
jgi:hypothetical protein